MGLFTLLATRFYALLGGVILLNFQLIVFSETTLCKLYLNTDIELFDLMHMKTKKS